MPNSESTLKKTALYPLHQELSAKLMPFAGYELPIQYQGIREEHLHTRDKVSVFDISHMGQIRLSGTDVAKHLEGLIPNYMTDLKHGQQRYTVLLNEQGGIVDDLMVSRYDDDLILVVNGACKEKDFNYLRHYLTDDVNIEWLQDRALIAVQGPCATKALEQLNPDCGKLYFMQCGVFEISSSDCYISRSGYTGEDGFEISIASDQVIAITQALLQHPDVLPAGLGARDTLRLEAGLCLYGHELDETVTPLQANLSWLVAKQRLTGENNYLGQSIIQQQLEQGVDNKRAGLLVEGKAPVREGCRILDSGMDPVGKTTSGGYSPTLKQPISMALLNKNYTDVGTELLAEVRQRTYPVKVTSMPFVQHRYHKQTKT